MTVDGLPQDVYAFDYDGTFFEAPGETANFRCPEELARLKPITWILEHARKIASANHRVAIVTGRSPELAGAILERLGAYGVQGVELYACPEFRGLDALQEWKRQTLSELRPAYYIGDQRLDEEAARQSLTPFIYAQDAEANLATINQPSLTLAS